MPLLSSPVAYPPSSSPPVVPEKRKKSTYINSPSGPKRRLLGFEDGAPKRKPLFRTLRIDACRPEVYEPPKQQKAIPKAKGPFIDDDDEKENTPEQNNRDMGSDDSNDLLGSFGHSPLTKHTDRETLTYKAPQETTTASQIRTSSGKCFGVCEKTFRPPALYEQLIASRSTTAPGSATKSFYGIDIHDLLDQANQEVELVKPAWDLKNQAPHPSIETPMPTRGSKRGRTMLWTEKYRARRYADLVGDERTHRDVLRWLKGWDPIVFPGSSKPKARSKSGETEEQRQHRKILMLTGPPGLGKTTLAHVCARQAGYEVVEINASDERSRDVVKGHIRDCLGTENVKGINTKAAGETTRRAGRPVCVVVDEVDGVVSGSGGSGEGGFMKALIDLAMLDQKNSNIMGSSSVNAVKSKKKGDRFRLLRPMILICNDVYHSALRPLRSSTMAEIIHIRSPPLDKVVARLKSVLDKEGVACDSDGVRRLCEATWGISKTRDTRAKSCGSSEGDIRGILVVGEWVAAKLRATIGTSARLSKKWIEEHVIESLSHGGGGARGLGRGGVKEAVERVFLDGAGFPKVVPALATGSLGITQENDAVGVAEFAKRAAMGRLRDIVDTSGETDRIITDCFATYPAQSWQDDTFLSKPNAAYEWLHFHDRVSSKVHVGQEWELGSYLSQSVLGFHNLFASSAKQSWASDSKRWDDNDGEEPLPFTGPRADFAASEALKQNKAVLQGLQSSLSIPLHRCFKSAEDISADLLPHLIKILTPDVKPIVVGGSGEQKGIVSVRKEGEREMIQRAVSVMGAVGVIFERARIESNQNGTSSYIYRMEP